MTVSELIKDLLYMKESYGDLDVSITTSYDGGIATSDCLYINLNQYEDFDEINIRDFPY